MKHETINSVYFIGIGGIGMSALARYFKAMGKRVSGYDRTETVLTKQLQKEGIDIHFIENLDLIPKDVNLVVYTPAVPKSHSELIFYRENNFQIKKRAEVLGMVVKNHFTVAVAGTHGKTTISAMVAHILKYSSIDCTAFVGGIMKNYDSNFILPDSSNQSRYTGTTKMVVEADEYDRSFLQLHPDIAVITSMDADHLDIYGNENQIKETFSLFAKQVKEAGILIYKQELPLNGFKVKSFTYSINEVADYSAQNITVKNGNFVFDVQTPTSKIENINISLPGRHNVENTVAAIAVADRLKIDADKIKKSLETFQGIKRRFEHIVKTEKLVFIDDYAHHPTELKAAISAARELYPGKKITGIFQPHLFTRTRDFADEFASSLELLDELLLLEIYPAREEPIEGVNSKMLLEKINLKNKVLLTKDELLTQIGKKNLQILLTLGAGDIDKLVEPIKNKLKI